MIAGLIQRLDDRINPVVVKELRQAVKSRFVVAVLLLFLVAQLGWIALQLLTGGARGEFESSEFELGRQVFLALEVILMTTCLVFIPLYTSIRLSAERNETNVDLLYATTIRPRSIIAGKIFSAMVLAILIFSACMPFMALTYYLRGIDWPMILLVLGIDFVVVAFGVQVMVFCAVVPGNLAVRILMALAGLAVLGYSFAGTVGFTVLMLEGMIFIRDEKVFWLGLTSTLSVLGLVGGLFFTWSVALISPPASNRALGVRIYMLVATVISGVGALMLSHFMVNEAPIVMWIVATTILAVIALTTAISERRDWSPRVSRRIPVTFLQRLGAFPFFSGAAGGVFFSLLLMATIELMTLVVRLWGPTAFLHVFMPDLPSDIDRARASAWMGFLYAYCYGMTGVLFQRLLLPRRPSLTWGLSVCFLSLGVAVPYLISMLVMLDRWRYDQTVIWFLTNPFVAIGETVDRGRRPGEPWMFLLFALNWAGLVTLLNLRWFTAQFDRFRRSESAIYVPSDRAAPEHAAS